MYTRRQVLLAFVAGCLLLASILNPLGILALLSLREGGLASVQCLALVLYLGVIVAVLWATKQAFTANTIVSRKWIVLLVVLAIGVGLLSWFFLLPQMVVGYLGMPRRIVH